MEKLPFFNVHRPDAILSKLTEAMEKVDVVVTTGGVSMGDKVHLLPGIFHIDQTKQIKQSKQAQCRSRHK